MGRYATLSAKSRQTASHPLAVVAGPWLNLDMPALANSFDTTARRINERLVVLALLALAGCDTLTPTYTLYRSSTTGPMRIHVATFNSNDGVEYNRENCQVAMGLFQRQPGVKVRYWCEKGRYRA